MLDRESCSGHKQNKIIINRNTVMNSAIIVEKYIMGTEVVVVDK